MHDVGHAFDDVVALVSAAAAVEPIDAALGQRVGRLVERVAGWPDRAELDSFEPELDGAQVMALLGIPPGRDVGRALAFLQELRLDDGVVGPTTAADRLRKWWTDHSE
jgi:poly(A) polymerase